MIRRPQTSTLFPSPTLFRSARAAGRVRQRVLDRLARALHLGHLRHQRERAEVPAGADELGDGRTWAWHTPWNASIDRKSTRLNSSHANISYAVFCLKKKTTL